MRPGVPRSILLWGAPLAFAGALLLQSRLNRFVPARIEIDRQQAIATSQELAAALGVRPEGWTRVLSVPIDNRLEEFLEKSASPQRGLARRLLNPYPVEVLQIRPDGNQWMLTSLRPDGSIGGFRRKGTFAAKEAAGRAAADYQAMAQTAVLDHVPRGLEIALGEPEAQRMEGSADPAATRYLWRADLPKVEGLDVNVTAEVEDGVVTRLEFSPFYEDSPLGQAGLHAATVRQMGNLGKVLLLVAAALYGCYRYARRALEREAPHRRALLVAAVMIAFGVMLVIIDPAYGISGVPPERLVGGGGWFIRIIFISTVAVQGVLLALAYGAGEGEIREGYAGKLTSLDCLIMGKVFSANVGRSVVCGAALGGWILLAGNSVLTALGTRPEISGNSLLRATFAQGHWAILLFSLLLSGVMRSVLGLLLPMTFARRHIHSRKLSGAALAAAAVVMSGVANALAVDKPTFWVDSACCAAALLVSFFAFDYLASIVAVTVFSFGWSLPEVAAFSKVWRGYDMLLYVVLALTVVAAAVIWRAGREYGESQVRPQYARNMAQRLAMQAEMDAARQAQLRLLPDTPPAAPGITIAASCTPATEVSGDYYDFFPLPGGVLGIAVAEGGNDGLASALTIALTKGFLMVESGRGKPPRKILEDLVRMLGRALKRSTAQTGVLYAVVDPRARTLEVASTGEFPKGAVLHADGSVSEAAGTLALSAGDTLLFFTDGIPRTLGAGESPQELLRRAAGAPETRGAQSIHDGLLNALLHRERGVAKELSDDLTAVVIHFEDQAGRVLEDVA